MREAIESPLETRIAAQPSLLVEAQPEEEADPEANHNPQPRENQVKLGSVRVHDFKFRLNEATLAGRSCGVLIDNGAMYEFPLTSIPCGVLGRGLRTARGRERSPDPEADKTTARASGMSAG